MKSLHKSYKLLATFGVLLVFALSTIGFKLELKALDKKHYLNANNDRFGMEPEESEEAAEEGPRPDRPDEAAKFRRLQLQDEKGLIPADGLEKAQRQVELMKAAQQERNKNRPANGALAGIKPNSWTWLGPGNVGGRIRSIVIHPTITNRMWVGSVGGGIWRSENGGNSWFPVDDFMANLAVSTMIIDPNKPDNMYAGTGEGFGNVDSLQGGGVFKSLNGGMTWTRMANTNPAAAPPPVCGTIGAAPCPAFWSFVNRLAISPDGSTILAATNNGIARSVNGGTSWILGALTQTFDVNFRSSVRAIAGGSGTAGLTTDGGLTWTPLSSPPPPPPPAPQPVLFNPQLTPPSTPANNTRVEVEYNQFNPDIVYALVNQNGGDVYRSSDGGQNFTRVNTGTNLFAGAGGVSSGWYNNILWVKPQDPTFVIVGGIDLWRSTDNGSSFTRISQWQNAPAQSAHADHHAIVAHPGFDNSTNRTVFFGNDGGIYRTDNVDTVDKLSGWTAMNDNLGITQFYSAAGNPTTGVIIGGAQDNGAPRYTGSVGNWGMVTNPTGGGLGDAGFCAADPTDSNFFYTEYINLQIYRSTDGGVSASRIDSGIGDANNSNTANFIAPFILDPNNSNTMLAGGVGLWRSTNVKAETPTWTQIKLPVVPPPPPPSFDVRISAIAISPATSNYIVVGHNDGDIYRTLNGAPATNDWERIDAANLPDRMVTRLVIDSTRATTWIYATFGGFSPNNVYRSTDSGITWTNISGTSTETSLPAVPVRSLVYHPSNPNLLYVGTEIGIFTSDDAGATWEVIQNGPANVSVDELFWMGGDLIAVTHGRGLYRASGGIYVDCNYPGMSDGSFDRPYRTVREALNAATVYRTIWLKPCTYNEPMRIDNINGVEFRSLGGVAVIRQ